MMLTRALIVFFCLWGSFATNSFADKKTDLSRYQEIHQSLVQILPMEEKDLKRLPLGCTGFYIDRKLMDPTIQGMNDSAFFVTNLHCVLDPEKLMEENPSLGFIQTQITNHLGNVLPTPKIVGVHPYANLVIFRFSQKEPPKPLQFNFEQPVADIEHFVSVRYPTTNPNMDIQQTQNQSTYPSRFFKNRSITYLLHDQEGLAHGFAGSPLLDLSGQVIGINSHSQFLYFNVGLDFRSIIKPSQSSKEPIFHGMYWGQSSANDSRIIASEMDHHGTNITDNDAFEITMMINPMMQKTEIDPLSIYGKIFLNKFNRYPQHFPFLLVGVDFLMDIVFDQLIFEARKIQHERQTTNEQKTKKMNRIIQDFEEFFFVFKKARLTIQNTFPQTNDEPIFITPLVEKHRCKHMLYRKHFENSVSQRLIETQKDDVILETCEPYFKYLQKNSKKQFLHLSKEPYPSQDFKSYKEIHTNPFAR